MKTVASRLLLMSVLILLFINNNYAQKTPEITSVQGKLIRTTPPLSQIDKNSMYGKPLVISRKGDGFADGTVDPERAEEEIFKNVSKKSSNNVSSLNTVQTSAVPSPNTPVSSINLNIDGQTATGFAPSDNNLAVGPNHVIQVINNSSSSILKIWNKSGAVLQNSITISSITGLPGSGDPVVLYDQLADRWVLTEFGKTGSVSYINTLIIAVSTTPDPLSSWKAYSYNIGAFFVDYPKYAIWQNAYYATSNDFNTAGTSYLGSSIYAFDKAAMIAGSPSATMIRTRFTGSGDRYYSMAPVCQEGPAISNQSGLFSLIQDDAWVGAPKDSIYVFEFTPNFASPASSVVGPFRAIATTLPVNTNTGSLNQQGTSQTLQSLSQRLMNKVIYRNFGASESIVCTTTDLQNGRTGIHWWELRRPGSGNWNIYQEGLWQPTSDNNHRFLGSIAINAQGDIGLLYNVTGSTAYPSARFTGRSSCDPLNQMTLAETVVKDGTTFESSNNRYGDYNSLSVDPVNGSFWGTAQYNAAGYGTYGNWVTRVVNFTLTSSCGANAGTVSGTSPLCIGQTATYTTNGDPGGSWSSTNTSVASVNPASGLVTAIAAGTTNITYTVSGASAFKTLTVNANANAGTVSGSSSVCVGGTTQYTNNGDSGGSWSSDNTSVATVNASGLVSGVSAGSANITYTVTNSCNTSASTPVTINVAVCAGPAISCPGNINASVISGCSTSVAVTNPTISNTTTLTWVMTGATTGSSPNTGINYVGTRTFNIGTTTITYTASNGSQTATCSFTVTVTDNTPATITCPANITNTQNGPNKCSAVINVPNPNTSSNCSVTKLTWVMTGATTGSSPTTGINYVGTTTFPVGITTVTYTVTNGAGNTTNCWFTVTVRNKRCPGSPAAPLTGAPATVDKLIVTVSPNPSETYFTLLVQSSRTEDVDITIYTINGKLVQQIQGSVFESYRFGNSYTPGTYIVKVKQGNKETIVKVIR